jgi:hypothetical protein
MVPSYSAIDSGRCSQATEIVPRRRAFSEQSTCRDAEIQPNNWAAERYWNAFNLVARIFDNHKENFYGFFGYGMIPLCRPECH